MKLSSNRVRNFAAVTAMCCSAMSQAEPISFDSNIALASQYNWRGLDLSDNSAVIQGDFSVSHESGFSATIWGSQYDIISDDGVELDFVIDYSAELSDSIAFSVGFTEYTFSGDTDSSTEYYLGLATAIIDLTYYHDTDLKSDYFSFDKGFELSDGLELILHAGIADPDLGDSYNDYAIGVGYQWTKNLSVTASYTDIDEDVQADSDNFVAVLNYNF